jgi:hypothetical protein
VGTNKEVESKQEEIELETRRRGVERGRDKRDLIKTTMDTHFVLGTFVAE